MTEQEPQFGQFGLVLSAHDLSVKPGDDFYNYVDGTWVGCFSIPPDRSSYGSFAKLGEFSEQRVRDLIGSAAKSPAAPGSNAQKVGDFYASFMDQVAMDAKGLAPHERADRPRVMVTPTSNRSLLESLRIVRVSIRGNVFPALNLARGHVE